jgi:hypothetical protein
MWWFNKARINHLSEKINRLEQVVARLEYETQIWKPEAPTYNGSPLKGYVCSKQISLGGFRGSDHILLGDIVKLLLDKLGYEIKKTPQVKEGIKLTKK